MKTLSMSSFLVRVILIIGITLKIHFPILSQDLQIDKSKVEINKDEWWYPIIKKHSIKVPSFYTCKNVFETGKMVSKKDSIIEFQDAVFIIISGKEYYILTSGFAIHNLRNNTIDMRKGLSEMYNIDSVAPKPVEIVKFNFYKIDLVKNLTSLGGTDIWRDSTYTFPKYTIRGRKK